MVTDVRTNIRVLKRSRKKLSAGDIFAIGLPEDLYLFGRVIATEIDRESAPMPGANLIYIYSPTATTTDPPLDRLVPSALLVPPLFINRLPWSRGYFQTIVNPGLRSADMLPAHYFRRVATGHFVDERGQPVSGEPPPPVGDCLAIVPHGRR